MVGRVPVCVPLPSPVPTLLPLYPHLELRRRGRPTQPALRHQRPEAGIVLAIDVAVRLAPGQVVAQVEGGGVGHCPPVKGGRGGQGRPREVGRPEAGVGGRKGGGGHGRQLGRPPAKQGCPPAQNEREFVALTVPEHAFPAQDGGGHLLGGPVSQAEGPVVGGLGPGVGVGKPGGEGAGGGKG